MNAPHQHYAELATRMIEIAGIEADHPDANRLATLALWDGGRHQEALLLAATAAYFDERDWEEAFEWRMVEIAALVAMQNGITLEEAAARLETLFDFAMDFDPPPTAIH